MYTSEEKHGALANIFKKSSPRRFNSPQLWFLN
jgi:hypothetical protein